MLNIKKMNTQQYRDEHWETIVLIIMDGETDLIEDLYMFMMDELDMAYNKFLLQINLLNLFDLDKQSMDKAKKSGINELYRLLTKVVSTLIIFDKEELYEYSKKVYDKFYMSFELLMSQYNHTEEYDKIKENFVKIMGNSITTVKETRYFKDYE
jgi:hypothetical protein